jgi:predicted nucleotidyltransferase
MTIEQIKEMVAGNQYDFLRTNPHLAGKIIFLTLGGSYAYGTNVEISDVDIRGCALNSKSDLIGLSNFEQVVDNRTDTTIYSFNKLISLLLNCNPNTIELLGCKPVHYFMITEPGMQLISNKRLFLSQRAADSFGGYATQQLRRLQNAIARDRLPQAQTEEHIKGALERSIKSFGERYTSFENGGIELLTAESARDDLDTEVFCNIHLDKYPAREFQTLLNTLSSVVGNYEKLNHRNNKKDDNHLNKHAMHLIRLYLMCFDILENEDVRTYREADKDFLLSIRNGIFQNEDGSYRSEFFELVSAFEKRLQYDKKNTNLPASPNMKRIEDFVMSINRGVVCD